MRRAARPQRGQVTPGVQPVLPLPTPLPPPAAGAGPPHPRRMRRAAPRRPSVGRGSSRSSSPGGRRDGPTSGLQPGARGVRRRQRRVSRRPRPDRPGGLTHEHHDRPRRDPRPARPARCWATSATSTSRPPSTACCGWPASTGRSTRSHTRGTRLIVSGADLVDELATTSRFDKQVGGGLSNLSREGATSAGLFTSETQDPLWRKAHNILMAPFSLQAMRDYTPMMVDIAEQLMDKWARLNPGEQVDVPADMTRLTLDTIALCGFGYRFNSFYRDTPHPFVEAMCGTLAEAQARTAAAPDPDPVEDPRAAAAGRGPGLHERPGRPAHRRAPRAGRRGGQHRPARPDAHRRRQGQSGEGLPDSQHPRPVHHLPHRRARDDLGAAVVRAVLPAQAPRRPGTGPGPRSTRCSASDAQPTFEQVHRLRYVRQVLGETLRLWPTAPVFNRYPYEDTVIGGRYAIPARHPDHGAHPRAAPGPGRLGAGRGDVQPRPHRAGAAGRPSRRTSTSRSAPGSGPASAGSSPCRRRRSCWACCCSASSSSTTGTTSSGQDDAHHQAGRLPHPGAAASRRAARACRRRSRFHRRDVRRSDGGEAATATAAASLVARHGTRLPVLFGSNLGTAEPIAARLAQEGTERGFDVTVGGARRPRRRRCRSAARPCWSSARRTTARRPTTPRRSAGGSRRAAPRPPPACPTRVFGCGNTEWAATYQAVPDPDRRAAGGARRRSGCTRAARATRAATSTRRTGSGTAACGPTWPQRWTCRPRSPPVRPGRPAAVDHADQPAGEQPGDRVLRRPPGAGPGQPGAAARRPRRRCRHARPGTSRSPCPRASSLPGRRPPRACSRATTSSSSGGCIARFGLDAGQYLTIIPNQRHATPTCRSTSRRRCWACWAAASSCRTSPPATTSPPWPATPTTPTRRPRWRVVGRGRRGRPGPLPRAGVRAPTARCWTCSTQFPACRLPFEVFLDLLPPLRPRYYSISSSPLVSPADCQHHHRGGARHRPAPAHGHLHRGGLRSPRPATGRRHRVRFVREPTHPLPPTGQPAHADDHGRRRAPGWRRSADSCRSGRPCSDQGVPVAPSLLFFGCRNQETDLLYADETARATSSRAWSGWKTRTPANPANRGRYVQEAMLDCAHEVWDLLQKRGGRRPRLRQRLDHRPGRAPVTDHDLPGTHRHQRGRRRRVAGRATHANRFVEDIWGG